MTFQSFLTPVLNGTGLYNSVFSGNDTITRRVRQLCRDFARRQRQRRLHGNQGNDTLDGGGGAPTPSQYKFEIGGIGVNVDLANGTATDTYGNTDTLISIENVHGSQLADTITGGSTNNFIRGYQGIDSLDGGAGTDTWEAMSSGDASASSGAGNVFAGTQGITINLGTGAVTDQFGNAETGVNFENVFATNFVDTMTGTSGNNQFAGMKGADIIDGGAGNDMVRYDQDAGYGFAGSGSGTIIVNLSSTTQGGIASNTARDGFGTIDVLTSIEEARGSTGNDTFYGGDDYNFFQGRGGNDVYDGGNTVAYYAVGGVFQGSKWNWVDYSGDTGSNSVVITFTNGTATVGVDASGNTTGTGTGTAGGGEIETFTNINAIRGSMITATGDNVTGNSFANYFEGLAGADTFNGGAGLDRVGYNNDFRFTGSATATGAASPRGVIVNLSDDSVTIGADTLAAHTAKDTFNGTTGFIDTLLNVEQVSATNLDDTLIGSQFDNAFFTFNGNDSMSGGRGFDYFEPGGGSDTIDGSAGIVGGFDYDQSYEDRDEVSYDDFTTVTQGIYVDLNLGWFVDPTGTTDFVTDIERIRGTGATDILIGADFANQREENYRGLGGDDVIDGRNGFDYVDYSRDNDVGGASADNGIIANLSGATISVSGVTGTVGAVNVAAGTVLDGFGATDHIYYIEGVRATKFDDYMLGDGSRNAFRGMGGSDTIDGGDGLDGVEMYIGDYFLTPTTLANTGAIVNLSASSITVGATTVLSNTAVGAASPGNGITSGVTTLINIEDVSGSASADVIHGSSADNALGGSFGDDTIFGGDGNDKINGGQGANVLDGGDGVDVVSFMYDRTQDDYFFTTYPDPSNGFVLWTGVNVNLGTNSAIGFDGLANTLTNFENVTGTFFDDTITGDGNANVLRGLSGNDSIDGAGGSDTVTYSPTNGDGRVLVPIVGINYSAPNGVQGQSHR